MQPGKRIKSNGIAQTWIESQVSSESIQAAKSVSSSSFIK